MRRMNINLGIIIILLVFSLISCVKPTEPKVNQPPILGIEYPANNAIDTHIDIRLVWNCNDPENDSLSYNVYFGLSSPPPLVSSFQSESIYYPGILVEATTYYWKILSLDDNGNETFGDIWQFTTGVGFIPDGMVFIQGGSFEMGDHFEEDGTDELPVHTVSLNNFFIDKYEVTQAEYEAIVGNNPANGSGVGDDYPVYNINWYNAVTYCNLKSQQEGLTTCYNLNNWSCDFNANGYRLPTEAEWEYTARGGVYWTDDLRYSGCHEESELVDYAWYISNSNNQTHPVGSLLPNQLNIYDMDGNVYEWCNDKHAYEYYSSSPSNNPTGPEFGVMRVVRGGSWSSDKNFCRVADRSFTTPSIGSQGGIRIVKSYP